jgi:phage shock protein A
MGILKRLNRLVRSEFNDALERSDGRAARSALDEMESSLREARRRQSEMRRNEEELIEAIRSARQKADEWEERAMLALENDDEELAREALQVKNESVRRAERLREELRNVRSHVQDIETSLDALEMKLQSHKKRLRREGDDERADSLPSSDRDRSSDWDDRLERRREGDDSRDRSDARASSSERGGGDSVEPDEEFETDGTFQEFDRMAGKIDQMEAEIEATRELSDDLGDSRRSKLERIFRRMEDEAGRKRRSEGRDESDRDRRRSRKRTKDRERRSQRDASDGGETRRERDDLSGLKDRVDRLSELKDKFSDDE